MEQVPEEISPSSQNFFFQRVTQDMPNSPSVPQNTCKAGQDSASKV